MRYKSIADIRDRLGPDAAAQVERQLTREVVNRMISKPRKYRNEPCVGADGSKFDSKKERRDYERLCAEHGERNVIRQVSIPIGERRIRPDFMVIISRNGDGTFVAKLMDSKGMETREWAAKSNHLLDKHGISIKCI